MLLNDDSTIEDMFSVLRPGLNPAFTAARSSSALASSQLRITRSMLTGMADYVDSTTVPTLLEVACLW